MAFILPQYKNDIAAIRFLYCGNDKIILAQYDFIIAPIFTHEQ